MPIHVRVLAILLSQTKSSFLFADLFVKFIFLADLEMVCCCLENKISANLFSHYDKHSVGYNVQFLLLLLVYQTYYVYCLTTYTLKWLADLAIVSLPSKQQIFGVFAFTHRKALCAGIKVKCYFQWFLVLQNLLHNKLTRCTCSSYMVDPEIIYCCSDSNETSADLFSHSEEHPVHDIMFVLSPIASLLKLLYYYFELMNYTQKWWADLAIVCCQIRKQEIFAVFAFSFRD